MTKENKISITLRESCVLYTLEGAEKIGDGDLIKGIKIIRNQSREKGIEEVAFYKKGTKSSWKLLNPHMYEIDFIEISGTKDEYGNCAIERRLKED